MPISGVCHECRVITGLLHGNACVTLVTHDVIAQVGIYSSSCAFAMDVMDFSDLPLDFLEDNYPREVVSKSLLDRAEARAKTLDWKNIPKDRCILPPELLSWIDEAAVENPPKKVKLDECQPLKDISNRFGSCITDGETLTTFSKGFVPANTKQNTQWAVRTFEAWSAWRNGVYQDDRVPSDVLTSGDAVALNKWLSLFVIQVRKQDGNKYPSKTINLLLAGLKCHMKEINPSTPNFLNEEDDHFKGLRGTRDTVARQLREQGIRASVKHAEVITHEEEALLWDQGIFGVSTPRSLFCRVLYEW